MSRNHFNFTTDRHGLPLVIWDNPPGHSVEFTPAELRKMARDLMQAADVSESPDPVTQGRLSPD